MCVLTEKIKKRCTTMAGDVNVFVRVVQQSSPALLYSRRSWCQSDGRWWRITFGFLCVPWDNFARCRKMAIFICTPCCLAVLQFLYFLSKEIRRPALPSDNRQCGSYRNTFKLLYPMNRTLSVNKLLNTNVL
jgi:hypothetical protein